MQTFQAQGVLDPSTYDKGAGIQGITFQDLFIS